MKMKTVKGHKAFGDITFTFRIKSQIILKNQNSQNRKDSF